MDDGTEFQNVLGMGSSLEHSTCDNLSLPSPNQREGVPERFSIERDHEYVLPVTKAAQQLTPQMRFFASPRTPPPWMKPCGKEDGGSLRPERYPHYAEYLARFVDAYRAEGIDIRAITDQHQPEFGPEADPSCRWTAAQQRNLSGCGTVPRTVGDATLPCHSFRAMFDAPTQSTSRWIT